MSANMENGKRRMCECENCTGQVDLRAQAVELSEVFLRAEPGLISRGRRTVLLASINACQAKYVELWDAGLTFSSGDQLHEDLAPCLRVRAHLEASLGLPFKESLIANSLWQDDLDNAFSSVDSFVKFEAPAIVEKYGWRVGTEGVYNRNVPTIGAVHKHVFEFPLVSMHIKLTSLVKALKEVCEEYSSIKVKARQLDNARKGDTKRAKQGLPVVKKTYMLSPGRVRTACLSPEARRAQETRRAAGLPATFQEEGSSSSSA